MYILCQIDLFVGSKVAGQPDMGLVSIGQTMCVPEKCVRAFVIPALPSGFDVHSRLVDLFVSRRDLHDVYNSNANWIGAGVANSFGQLMQRLGLFGVNPVDFDAYFVNGLIGGLFSRSN